MNNAEYCSQIMFVLCKVVLENMKKLLSVYISLMIPLIVVS